MSKAFQRDPQALPAVRFYRFKLEKQDTMVSLHNIWPLHLNVSLFMDDNKKQPFHEKTTDNNRKYAVNDYSSRPHG